MMLAYEQYTIFLHHHRAWCMYLSIQVMPEGLYYSQVMDCLYHIHCTAITRKQGNVRVACYSLTTTSSTKVFNGNRNKNTKETITDKAIAQ